MNDRLEKQINFIYTLEHMKSVYRRSHLIHADRYENDAEHSFHIATMALVLKEYAPSDVDIFRVVSMLLFHDVVEIEAGDTFAYDAENNKTKRAREVAAAEKLYGSLPDDQGAEFRALWDEFEAQETPESHFALAMDRMEPILLNTAGKGGTWRYHEVRYEDVLNRIEPIRQYEPLYGVVRGMVDDFFKNKGVLDDEDTAGRG
ncbi:MAG: HD domain-containing protein [Peptoniphilus sp.]|nr:HD domain-containing protein [Peptoniphilus sp.]MDD7363753.1 HD domain-containing protein [Bacillota bacterium]MDY6044138.1 HD domain-containing protein [Peptoniphilus sp.]